MTNYKEHPEDPAILFVRDISLVTPLMRRTDVNVVILERPKLRDRYKAIFNENSGETIERWHFAAATYKRYPMMEIEMPLLGYGPKSIKVDFEERIDEMKKDAPKELWSDLVKMSNIISDLSGKFSLNAQIFKETRGQNPKDKETYNFHSHDNGITGEVSAHISTTDAGLEIVIGATTKDFRRASPERVAAFKTVKTKAADIAFFKPHVIHRGSQEGIEEGRSAFAVFASYNLGIAF